MSKRLFDLLCAGAGLVLLAPLLLGIALWIKLDTPGPVFFRQQRVGRFGALFRIHKFRSMRADTARNGAQDDAPDDAQGGDHGGPQITVGADPRITRAGRFLRRTKLDELPQLFDVLAGSMSLVGPRPEVPRYVALYPAALRDKVLSVRPGITDPASIAYRDESTLLAQATDPERVYIEQVMPAKLRCAAEYVERMSLANDLRLIGATLRSLWTH
ncbi:MAG: sugar transferase [Burkholderiales bacterium]|nr:sugar transferase [Burkholderiales bacterium]